MPVATTNSSVVVYGDGLVTEFFFTFGALDAASIKIGLITALGVTPVSTADYTVTLNPDNIGGKVTFATAPLVSTTLYIFRETAQTQLIGVTAQNKYDPKVVQTVWDKLTYIVQELNARASRSLLVPPGSIPVDLLTTISLAVTDSAQSALLAQAWAESATAPGGVGTKSAKTWAEEAQSVLNNITSVSAAATLLSAGSAPTASFNPTTSVITIGIPDATVTFSTEAW